MGGRPPHRTRSDRLSEAKEIVDLAWIDIPLDHRELLESVNVGTHEVVTEPLGQLLDRLLISAGEHRLSDQERHRLDHAVGVWVPSLRLVLLNAEHPVLAGLDDPSYEKLMARSAWHEWGHALSLARATEGDISRGEQLLDQAPPGIAEVIREEEYRKREYTHELVAWCYEMLMSRRRRGQQGKPEWLANEIYELVRRVTGWSE